MNHLRERSDRLLEEPWLDADPSGVEAAVGRIRARRRRRAAIGAVMIVLVVGGAVLAAARAADTTSLDVVDQPARVYERDDVTMVVFLDSAGSRADADAVEQALIDDPEVGQAWRVTQQDAYDEFACMWADAPEMIESVTPEILPASFRIAAVAGTDPAAMEARLRSMPGALEVVARPDPYEVPPGSVNPGTSVVRPWADSACSGGATIK